MPQHEWTPLSLIVSRQQVSTPSLLCWHIKHCQHLISTWPIHSIHALMYTACSLSQIQKLLTMYTPGDFEGKVPSSLIRLIGEKCRQRDGSDGQQLLVHIDDSHQTPYAMASGGGGGPHSPDTITNLRSLSTPSSMMLDHLLIMIWLTPHVFSCILFQLRICAISSIKSDCELPQTIGPYICSVFILSETSIVHSNQVLCWFLMKFLLFNHSFTVCGSDYHTCMQL